VVPVFVVTWMGSAEAIPPKPMAETNAILGKSLERPLVVAVIAFSFAICALMPCCWTDKPGQWFNASLFPYRADK
jgi:hypothetical protein